MVLFIITPSEWLFFYFILNDLDLKNIAKEVSVSTGHVIFR